MKTFIDNLHWPICHSPVLPKAGGLYAELRDRIIAENSTPNVDWQVAIDTNPEEDMQEWYIDWCIFKPYVEMLNDWETAGL
jgi:hypothetical protein